MSVTSMVRFSIFGFPVQVHWLFWLTCALISGGFYATTSADWIAVAIRSAVIFVSIIVHELGHAFAARKFGGAPGIYLHGLGGLTVTQGLRLTRVQSILLSLAGPAAGFALGGLVIMMSPFLAVDDKPFAMVAYQTLVFVNIFWSIFNLLPVLPMDGGQVLRDILGPRRIRIATLIGGITAVVLCALAALVQLWFMAIFMAFLAYSNFKHTRELPIQGGVVK